MTKKRKMSIEKVEKSVFNLTDNTIIRVDKYEDFVFITLREINAEYEIRMNRDTFNYLYVKMRGATK